MVDLNVLVRSVDCESRACYVGNLCESFLSNSRKKVFYLAKLSRKLDILDHHHGIHHSLLIKGLPPPAARGSGRRMVPHICLSLHR